MHGTAASVSVASNSGNGSNPSSAALPKLHHNHRYSSRSNSISSSSVVTIKQSGSLSPTSTGAKNPSAVPMTSQSPGETSLIALRVGRDRVTQECKRRKSVAIEPPSSSHGENEGLNNLNRWSHSTNSSVASIGNARRSRASSGAGLQGLAQQSFPPQNEARAGIEHSPKSSPHRKPPSSRQTSRGRLYSPDQSPEGLRKKPSRRDFYTNFLTALPPLHTTPALTNEIDTESPSTIQTVATPSTQSSYALDYFGDDGVSPRNTAKNKRPVVIRNHTAPMSGLNQARTPGPEASQKESLKRSKTSDKHEHGSKLSDGSDGSRHRGPRTREGKEKDKKAMLSKALQKANTAVLLDNAQNFEGALEAYSDACRLLQQVMDRSSADEDKRKLEAIRVTYTNRIEELRQLELFRPSTAEDKTLPARPMSDDSILSSPEAATSPIDRHVRDSAVIETATVQRIVDIPKLPYSNRDRDSFFSRTMEAVQGGMHNDPRQAVEEEQPAIVSHTLTLPRSEDNKYMPRPLSPRKPPSPQLQPEAEEAWQHEPEQPFAQQEGDSRDRADSNDQSMTWLDTIDESGSECASSVHSLSKDGLRRKHLRGRSGETDPEFDDAFDAAVEAAYGEGFEPDTEARRKRTTVYKHALKESIVVPSSEIKEVLSPTSEFHPSSMLNLDELDDDEEERLLDEITSDYAQGFSFDLSSKSALPRQSDSSGYSRSTWQSSQAPADRNTAVTSLSTVAEDALSSPITQKMADVRPEQPPPSAPPMTALPKIPVSAGNRLSGVRGRRMSNPKALKIETSTESKSRKRASTFHHSPSPMREEDEQKAAFNKDFKFGASLESTPSDAQHDHILQSPPSLDMRLTASAASEIIRPQTAAIVEQRRSMDDSPGELRSTRPNLFRKNKSSMSLREDRILLSSPEDIGPSVITPMSSTFMTFSHKRNQDPLTSQRAKFSSFDTGLPGLLQSGGAYLFDTSLSAQQAPTSPRSPTTSAMPTGLEPCPESFLLRPFWLMRALASTLTHPKGGFLTMRLFVPREVWHTRGVKLKAVEDKVANCDLLTAALGRLAGVDTFDADAVMDELQSFEEVMERVQMALSKRLGSDVGLQSVSALFRDAAAGMGGAAAASHHSHQGADHHAAAGAEKAAKGREGKGYLNSWRKLRSKSSGTPLATSNNVGKMAVDKELPSLPSVPMTSHIPVHLRGHKRDVRNMAFEGPQKEYMGSLARLFEGVQVLGKSTLHLPHHPPASSRKWLALSAQMEAAYDRWPLCVSNRSGPRA